jgi:hypothetical protein
MAEKVYKVNESVELGYQAPGRASGKVVIAEIYLPNKAKDSNFPDITLVEVGNSGTYRGSFTPDAQGEWQAILHLDDGEGQVVKRFSVGGHNVHSVGEAVGGVHGAIDAVEVKVDAVDDKVDAVDAKVVAVDAKVDAVDAKIDGLELQVDSLDTPPMAF